AARGRHAADRLGPGRHSHAHQSAGRQGRQRVGQHGGIARDRSRDRRCAVAVRRDRNCDSGDAGARVAGDQWLFQGETMMRLLACVAALFFAAQATALDYPAKPVRLIMPFPPGGSVDGRARLIPTPLTERWGQTIVVEARPGAGGNIAYGATATSAPDGYPWVIAANGI